MRTRRRRLMAIIASAVSIAACTEDPPVAPAQPFSGVWELTTVNGRDLPFTVESTPFCARRLLSAQLDARTRGRLLDIKRTQWFPASCGTEIVTDTVTSPFSSTTSALFVRRYALLADADWVDTGSVNGITLQLRVRSVEPQFGRVLPAAFTYTKRGVAPSAEVRP